MRINSPVHTKEIIFPDLFQYILTRESAIHKPLRYVTYVSVVTGVDSKGYLVSCHNLDRNDVPWDIGWSEDKMKFILLNVSY